MTSTTAKKSDTSDAKAPSAKPTTIKNLKPAPFWYDDSADGPHLADKGMLLPTSPPAKLTEAQWKRRSPEAWGILLANDVITISNVPAADEAAVEAAEAKERARIGRADVYSAEERRVLRGMGQAGALE